MDKLSARTQDTEIQSYENGIMDNINSNLNVLIDETNMFTVLFEKSEQSKVFICNKLKEVAKSMFQMSHIESENKNNENNENDLDDALSKICSQYSIENVLEFTKKVKSGDFQAGCSKVKDRKERKKLMEELESFTLLN